MDKIFPARRCTSAAYAMALCPSVRLSQVGVLSKWQDGLSWFCDRVDPSLCYKGIRIDERNVPQKIKHVKKRKNVTKIKKRKEVFFYIYEHRDSILVSWRLMGCLCL